jgi:hypothetical protein
MINQIRKIQQIAQKVNANSIEFNNNLPITITVLEEMKNQQYKLLLGTRTLSARSKKKLKPKSGYWGDLNETKDGGISITNMIPKPDIFNSSLSFLDVEKEPFLQSFITLKNPLQEIKKSVLKKLSDDKTTKEEFLTLSYMLLAYEKSIFHLPASIKNKKVLIQFQINQEKNVEFYLAFENLGPIKGIITSYKDKIIIDLYVIFKKSYNYIKKALKDLDTNINFSISTNIKPFFNSSELLLDIKG